MSKHTNTNNNILPGEDINPEPGVGTPVKYFDDTNFSLSDDPTQAEIDDLIRARSGLYWTRDGEKVAWRENLVNDPEKKEIFIKAPLIVDCTKSREDIIDKLYYSCEVPSVEEFLSPAVEGEEGPFQKEVGYNTNNGKGSCDDEEAPQGGSGSSSSPDTATPGLLGGAPVSWFYESAPAIQGGSGSPLLTVIFEDGTQINGYRYVELIKDSKTIGGGGTKPRPRVYKGQTYYRLRKESGTGQTSRDVYVRRLEGFDEDSPLSNAGAINASVFPGSSGPIPNSIEKLPYADGGVVSGDVSIWNDPNPVITKFIIVGIPGFTSGNMLLWSILPELPGLRNSLSVERGSGSTGIPEVDAADGKFDFVLRNSDNTGIGSATDFTYSDTEYGKYRLYNVKDMKYGVKSGDGGGLGGGTADPDTGIVAKDGIYTAIYIEPATQLELVTQFEFQSTVTLDPTLPGEEFVMIRANKASKFYVPSGSLPFGALQQPQGKKEEKREPNQIFKAMLCGGTAKGVGYTRAIFTNKYYNDYAFEIKKPYPKKQINISGSTVHTMYATVDPVYNFYIERYEESLALSTVTENSLPNLYALVGLMEYTPTEQDPYNVLNPEYRDLMTLENTLRYEKVIGSFIDFKGKKWLKFNRKALDLKNAKGQYFDQWGRQVKRITNNLAITQPLEQALVSTSLQYSNVVVTHENLAFMNRANQKKELFPMFVDINFSTSNGSLFSSLLENAGMSVFMMNSFINRQLGEDVQMVQEHTEDFPAPNDMETDLLQDVTSGGFKPKTTVVTENTYCVDVFNWIGSIKSLLSGSTNTSLTALDALSEVQGADKVFVGNELKNIIKASEQSKYLLHKLIALAAFEQKVAQLAEKYTRTYCDILEGRLAKHETVFYRVQKTNLASGDTQNIWLPNSANVDVMNYIDTQVKYGQKYRYEIFAYELVYGTRYIYSDYLMGDDCAGANVRSLPSVKIIETPYYSYINNMVDSPPVSPDVAFIPYRAVGNKVKITFNSNVGSYEQYPEIIETEEREQVRRLLRSQDKYDDEKLFYESDDQSTEYEIWRLEQHPYSYRDFSGNKVKTLITDFDTKSSQKPTSGAFIDTIKPNKKYWYTFRSKDVHGNISYPTPVYEVEMVDEFGAVYPRIKAVDFLKINPKMRARSLKKMLHITPRISHTVLNESASGLDGATSVLDRWYAGGLKLGVQDKTIWNKRFKFRLTSKKTCRKIDFNVRCKYKHRKIEPE